MGQHKAGHHIESQLPKLPMRKRADKGEMWLEGGNTVLRRFNWTSHTGREEGRSRN